MAGKILLLVLFTFLVLILAQNEECKCVPFHLCDFDKPETKKKKPLLDIRLKPDDCSSYFELCCALDKIRTRPDTYPPPTYHGCGYRNKDGVGHGITGDKNNEAQFGEFPWMVAIFTQNPAKKHVYECGGSLIHPKVVMTATHCLLKGSSYKVRVGEWDAQTTKEIYKYQDMGVKEIIRHPKYDADYLSNDLSLLILEDEVMLGPHVNTICLPPAGFTASGSGCIANGWGKKKFEKKGRYQTILKKIVLPIMARGQCEQAFKQTRLGDSFDLDLSFMCAGGQANIDACTGDGGGALACPINNSGLYQQVGIISWGIGCGTAGVPGAYTDVAKLRQWIDTTLRNKGLNISSYQP